MNPDHRIQGYLLFEGYRGYDIVTGHRRWGISPSRDRADLLVGQGMFGRRTPVYISLTMAKLLFGHLAIYAPHDGIGELDAFDDILDSETL